MCKRHRHGGRGDCRIGADGGDAPARPGEIIGAAGGNRQGIAFLQGFGRGLGRRLFLLEVVRASGQFVGVASVGEGSERHGRSGERTRRRSARRRRARDARLFLQRLHSRQRNGLRRHRRDALDLALDVMRKLARAGLGEMNSVARAQTPVLTLEIGALEREAALVIDKAVPDVDIDDAGFFGAGAEQFVEIARLARGLLRA